MGVSLAADEVGELSGEAPDFDGKSGYGMHMGLIGSLNSLTILGS